MLTISFRRAEMSAFWFLIAVIVSVVTGLTLTFIDRPAPWWWAVAAGLGVIVPGVLWPVWFELGISAWNRGIRLLTSPLRQYTLLVLYYLLLGAVSRTGTSFDYLLERPPASRWVARMGHEAIDTLGRGWVRCLLPFVLLLRVLRDERAETAPPSGTYTLY